MCILYITYDKLHYIIVYISLQYISCVRNIAQKPCVILCVFGLNLILVLHKEAWQDESMLSYVGQFGNIFILEQRI